MSIAGINGYNYSNYYTGTKRNTAKANGMIRQTQNTG